MTAQERLTAIRQAMAAQGLDGLIVPRFDAHQGEYCSPHDNRLAFATGFSGSAGVALILKDQAVIFVDGRYQTQVRQEIDLNAFSVEHFFDYPLDRYLADKAARGARIGVNTMLIPVSWQQKYRAALAGRGAELVGFTDDLIDGVWPDQPAPPLGRVEAMPVAIAGQSVADKRAAVAAKVKAAGADFLVETQPDNIAWLLNVRGSDIAFNPMPQSFLILRADGTVEWFVDERKLPNALEDFEFDGVVRAGPERFIARVTELGQGGAAHLDPDFTSAAVAMALEKPFIAGKSPVALTKAVKNPVELDGFRRAHRADGAALTRFLHWIDSEGPARAAGGTPLREREVQEKLLQMRGEGEGFSELSFATISASGGNAAMSHYNALRGDNAAIGTDSVYLIDSGGQYRDGTTDVTRTTAIGPVRFEVKRAYTAVLKGFISMITLRFPRGTQGHQIDAFARRSLWDLGLDYDHGTGHGVGHRLSVHEGPHRFAKVVNPFGLDVGMVMTIEPGYYEAGRFGIRIENQVEIIDGGRNFLQFDSLTLAPIDLKLALIDRLTPGEVDWLDTYHARVRREVLPGLAGAEADWLLAATRPVAEQAKD